jgi:hypothetical protein
VHVEQGKLHIVQVLFADSPYIPDGQLNLQELSVLKKKKPALHDEHGLVFGPEHIAQAALQDRQDRVAMSL